MVVKRNSSNAVKVFFFFYIFILFDLENEDSMVSGAHLKLGNAGKFARHNHIFQ